MKKIGFLLLLIMITTTLFQSCNEPIVNDQTNDELSLKSAMGKISYIVVLKDAELEADLATEKGYEAKQEKAKAAAEKILKRAGITDGELGFVYGSAIQGFSVKISPGQLKKLQDDPSVKYVEEDQIVTLVLPEVKPDAGKPSGGGGTQPSQTIPWGITRVNGGGNAYSGKNVAWIIDTGIDLNHPELNVDNTKSKNFVERETSPEDLNGHGTHVSGIIAAKNNTFGSIGVAPGATVIAIRVLNRQGSGTYSAIIAGVDYVKANGKAGDVANMSLGGGKDNALNQAVKNAAATGILFTLAAGNESTLASSKSPASASVTGNQDNIYTISAMKEGDIWAYYSNYGNPPVDYCEPGTSIYSTWKDGGYNTISGTSMAAPHAAGILLLGAIRNGGTVLNDPDSTPDPIGVH